MLILDRDPGGPRLLPATIAVPSDVRPAPDASGPYGDCRTSAPPAAIARNIGLTHASAPTRMDEVFGRSNVSR